MENINQISLSYQPNSSRRGLGQYALLKGILFTLFFVHGAVSQSAVPAEVLRIQAGSGKQSASPLRQKSQLAREGKYSCCLKIPCDQCALDHQSCPCYKDLKAGNPVCNECHAGWQRGEGKDKDIDPKDVRRSFSTHRHD